MSVSACSFLAGSTSGCLGELAGFARGAARDASSWEQDVANRCLRLAIAGWVAREPGMELGFVVLREVFGSQDEDNPRQRLLDALRSLGARFHQLLVITHVADIAALCNRQLVVSIAEPDRSVAEIQSA